jgi:hypothetical protein
LTGSEDIKRIGFSLIRVYRFQTQREGVATDNVLLSQLKWPIEYMFIGLRPTYNISSANTNQWRDWHNMALLTDNVVPLSAQSYAQVVIDDTVAWNAGTGKTKQAFSQVESDRVTWPSTTTTIDTLRLQAHGINIYQEYNYRFYNEYQPYIYGGVNIITPEDRGACMMNFCLYPGTYQPSGHINVSRAREFYLQFVSSYCGSSTQCDLLVLKLVQKSMYKIHISICVTITIDHHCVNNHTYARFPNCGEVLKHSLLKRQVNGLDDSKNVNDFSSRTFVLRRGLPNPYHTKRLILERRRRNEIMDHPQPSYYRAIYNDAVQRLNANRCNSIMLHLRYSLALCESNRDQPWRSPLTSYSF